MLSEKTSVSISVKQKIIEFACRLLEQSNFHIQQQFYSFFVDELKQNNKNYIKVFVGLFQKSFKNIVKLLNKINENNFDIFYKKIYKNKEKVNMEMDMDLPSVNILDQHLQFCSLVVNFLRLLCTKNFVPMQNLLRVQYNKENHSDINAIRVVVKALKEIMNFSYYGCSDFIMKVLHFLIEVIKGPLEENQLELESLQVEEICLRLIEVQKPNSKFKYFRKINNDDFNFFFVKIENLCFLLLYYLMEGNKTKLFLITLSQSIRFSILFRKMDMLYDLINASSTPDDAIQQFIENRSISVENQAMEITIETGFIAFYLIKYIAFETTVYRSEIAALNEREAAIFDYFNSRIRSIEISFKDKIELTFFVAPHNIIKLYTYADNYIDQINKDSYFQKLTETIRNVPLLVLAALR
jgi:hypothetical protein